MLAAETLRIVYICSLLSAWRWIDYEAHEPQRDDNEGYYAEEELAEMAGHGQTI